MSKLVAEVFNLLEKAGLGALGDEIGQRLKDRNCEGCLFWDDTTGRCGQNDIRTTKDFYCDDWHEIVIEE